jgi:hypothetical protein
MPGYDNWNDYLKEGFKQAREEGREEAAIAELEPQIEAALSEAQNGDDSRAASLLEQLLAIPVSTQFPLTSQAIWKASKRCVPMVCVALRNRGATTNCSTNCMARGWGAVRAARWENLSKVLWTSTTVWHRGSVRKNI